MGGFFRNPPFSFELLKNVSEARHLLTREKVIGSDVSDDSVATM